MQQKILIVDEHPTACSKITNHLEPNFPDTHFLTAVTGEEAVKICTKEAVDCIVSSHQLGSMDGLDLLEATRDILPELPFILFTDSGSEALASEAISAGVTDYVRKAGDGQYELLANRIANAIEQYHSQTRYQDLFEAVDDAIIVHDPQSGDIIDINRAVCDYWGYPYDVLSEADIEKLSSPQQPSSERTAREWIRRTVEDGPQRVEWVFETKNGNEFWGDVRLKPATLNGQDRVIALIRDITEAKHREQELQTFREAVEHAGHSVYVTDSDEEIIYANPAFEEITGYSVDEAIGQTPRLLRSGEHNDEFYQELWDTILSGDVWQNELINEHKDGSRYIVNQTISPITDEKDDIVRFVAINAEITEQKRRERQLQSLHRATREWLEANSKDTVYKSASDLLTDVFEFDLHGFCLYDEDTHTLDPVVVSEHADITFSKKPEFQKGEGIIWTVFESGDSKRCDDVRNHSDVYNPETDIRSELLLPLGEYGVLLIGSKEVAAFNETDETLANILASTLTTVLNRIERQDELRDRNSRLEEFASVVSHDLRNPLSVAQGHLELAKETGDDGHLEEIETSHNRMERIIDDLLWLSTEGREIGETRSVDLSHTVDDAWGCVETYDAVLTTNCDRTIKADPDRLQQLFENLFRNAIEHGGKAIHVRVGLVDDGYYVEDNGPGIPEEERERVFEPNYSTTAEGTGYGLSIVETIADGHGWELELTDSEDGGARFEFSNIDFS